MMTTKHKLSSLKPRVPKFIADMSYDDADKAHILKAYYFARTKHNGQYRRSGEPYIIHPVAVAQILASWHVDRDTICAGLLHDTLEDTDTSQDELQAAFGATCTELVIGVTKIGSLQSHITHTVTEESLENLRKLLLAMSRDIRVILVKLADRLHNSRTFKYLPPAKQHLKAQETIDIYAPIADRLGMSDLRAELEDRAFSALHPEDFAHIEELARPYIKRGEGLLKLLIPEIVQDCTIEGIEFVVSSRIKNVYSIHKKLQKYDQDFTRIRDLVALRIIVDTVPDCYRVLGLIHARYKPLLQYIKDYIAVPKPNGYQSLHTTVLGKNQIFEVQIRTKEMHQYAEQGLAAHFYYNQSKGKNEGKNQALPALPKKYEWVNNLLDWQEAFEHESDVQSALQLDVFHQRIFVFSPNGDLFDLPEGATPIDFAFAVHSDLGLACRGARVNARMMPLDTRLENRDVVEIFSFVRSPRPSRDWLSFVVTTKARSHIKAWLRNQEKTTAELEGMRLLDQIISTEVDRKWAQLAPRLRASILAALEVPDVTALAELVYEGRVKSEDISRLILMHKKRVRLLLPKRFFPRKGPRPVSLVPGVDREHIYRSGCCSPHYPQKIVGFVSRVGVIRIHREDCDEVALERRRCLPAYWYFDSTDKVRLIGERAQAASILKALSAHLAGFDARAAYISQQDRDEQILVDVQLSLVRMDRLADLLRALARIPGVTAVKHLVGSVK